MGRGGGGVEGRGEGEVKTIIIVRPVRVERGVLESDVIHRGVQSGCSFEGCCEGSNTPWLRANSDANNPYRCLREPLGIKGVRQSVVITNYPSTIDQNQQLLVRFPNLGAHDVIVPRTARLAFRITRTELWFRTAPS